MFLVLWNECLVILPLSQWCPMHLVPGAAGHARRTGGNGPPRRSGSIAVRELVPVVLAVEFWGSQWASRRVLIRYDTMAMVVAVNVSSVRDPPLMQLLQCLHFFCAVYGVMASASHIKERHHRYHFSQLYVKIPHFGSPGSGSASNPAIVTLQAAPGHSMTSRRWRQLGVAPSMAHSMGRGHVDFCGSVKMPFPVSEQSLLFVVALAVREVLHYL